MALASLCADSTSSHTDGPKFHGLIVDHGLRHDSAQEASAVREELRRLNIKSEVLTLDWSSRGDPIRLENVESVSRTLRYQALGRACRRHGITSLLVAHHADDQAETVLVRILSKHHGSGLRGIKPHARLPECEGIYGVYNSGDAETLMRNGGRHDGLLIEHGGVKIARPLLGFRKEALVTVCQEADTTWFEDHTNADPGHTLRNTVRYLLKQDVLPSALQHPRLCAMSARLQARDAETDHLVQEVFEQVSVVLDLRNGSAICDFGSAISAIALAGDNAYHLACVLTRKVLSLVAPIDGIALQDLHGAVDFVMPGVIDQQPSDLESATLQGLNVAGVLLRRETHAAGNASVTMHRSMPFAQHAAHSEIALEVTAKAKVKGASTLRQSKWHLWDRRYWIRIYSSLQSADEACDVIVRMFKKDDLPGLRREMDGLQKKYLNHALSAAPGNMRFTLPVIVARRQTDASPGRRDEEVVALPSIGWSKAGWRRWTGVEAATSRRSSYWDIRYKHVELGDSIQHRLAADSSPPRALGIRKDYKGVKRRKQEIVGVV